MGLLVPLVTVLALVQVSVFGDTGCRRFKNLDNGQTFFRYGGLMVIFRCHPGYKLHGHKTNSCVSGHWSRELPVCVGSGCSHPGSVNHGTSRMNEDGSWAEFSCNRGFRLHGPLMIYCKGHTWNSTKPVCKEADIMSSVLLNSLYDLNALQKLQISAALKNQHLHFKAVSSGASKEARLGFDRLPYAPFKMLKGERYDLTNPRGDLIIEQGQFPSDGTETTQGTRRFGSVAQTSHDSARNLDEATQTFSSEDHFPSTVRSAHQTERSAYEPRLSTTPAPAGPAVTAAPAGGDLHRSTTSSLASSSSCPSSTQSSTKTQISDDVTLLSHISNSTDLRSTWREFHNFTQSSTAKPVVHFRTMCPYPPVPLHGTFYFRNLENPGPNLDECAEGQHQCQQSCINTFGSFRCGCHVGYQPTTDQASCVDVDECLLPAAATGCVFGCVNTPGSFLCSCPDGFSRLRADGRCQDIDECAVNDGLGPCKLLCHNLPGSYRCSCSSGYILAGDGHSCFAECPPGYRKKPLTRPENSTGQNPKLECADINECLENMCEWQCINLPGSHRCICPRGYTLHRDGRHCEDINECNQKNGGCSHLCLNRSGGYKCSCPASHRMSSFSWKKCLLKTTAPSAG
ncbi:latent-transforming growth factor beta-binding protein 2 isoform X2 [Poecilia reticulata]|uniref:latent-transforming growth factor beta-binding protein 2 isoform X2 n=1 Tax=Poecilia reticulata TaxID=8081 RepID=UPI0007EBA1E0|nr:PREDICTED: latent-transforming growth factor beta-binding protein 2-like isoform X2 [Poecilia reticulata]